MTRLTICAALILVTPAFADDYQQIVESALSGVSNEYHLDWAFTETEVEGDLTKVGRYDPRNTGDDRWTLISIDGRAPTHEEKLEYQKDRHNEFADEDGDSEFDMVNLDTVELVDETDEFWIFGFAPVIDEDEDKEGKKFLQRVTGRLAVDKTSNDLLYFDLCNEKPIRPAFSVRISHFLTRLEFGRPGIGGPNVPLSMNVEIKGRALLAVSIDETQSVQFTDYEYVGD